MITKLAGTAIVLLFLVSTAAADTILLFDMTGGVSDHEGIDQLYGDRVTGLNADAKGSGATAAGFYGTDGTGFTPNVVVTYGPGGEDPALWTTGYGDLTNSYFNDLDNDTTFTTNLTADAGYLVDLVSFDLASFIAGGQTIQGAVVRDLITNVVLWSIGVTAITGTTHNSFTPNVTGASLQLQIDLSGLGGLSDDIGLDNLQFGQQLEQVAPVPEPGTMSLFGLGAVAAAWKLRRRRNTGR